MGRHFSESEVTAMGRNKNEDKHLKLRLSRLKEEKTFSYDNFAKEKKRVLELLKENRRTSGNTLVGPDEKDISEDSIKDVLLSRRPWSCTPHENTFNVIYREASDPGLLKATYRLKEKGTVRRFSRRTSAKSVPTEARSLAVSRQSTRSEPTFKRPLTCVPREKRKYTEKSKQTLTISEFKKKLSKSNNKEALNTVQGLEESRPSTSGIDSQIKNRTINIVSNTDEIQNLEHQSYIISQEQTELEHPKPSIDIPTILLESNEDKDASPRPKSRVKKRLSILEPSEDKKSENEHSLTKIYELDEIKSVNDLLNDTNIVEITPVKNDEKPVLTDKSDPQQPQTGTEKGDIPTISADIEGNSSNVPIDRRSSRPSIAFGETLDVVDFSSIHFSEPEEDYIMYKGRPIHNYVKPQLRYKYDPFSAKSRERLIQKLTTDTAVLLKDESNPIKHHRVYSKGARTRMLKQLVDENNSLNRGVSHNHENDKLESRIQEFYDSISQFCRQNSAN